MWDIDIAKEEAVGSKEAPTEGLSREAIMKP